jgi:hypothetical protein
VDQVVLLALLRPAVRELAVKVTQAAQILQAQILAAAAAVGLVLLVLPEQAEVQARAVRVRHQVLPVPQ